MAGFIDFSCKAEIVTLCLKINYNSNICYSILFAYIKLKIVLKLHSTYPTRKEGTIVFL